MDSASAFSPGHITGIFQIFDESPDPLLQGSRGAGFSIKLGVKTIVEINRAPKNSYEIMINGKISESASVSKYVLNHCLSLAEKNFDISVNHEANIPIGSGFGSSGAGALGLALALNEVLDLGLSSLELAQIAHIAEVECKTGLGSVIAEASGGLEIRMYPGAPGIGEIRQIPIGKDYSVSCLHFGPIQTSRILRNEEICRRINLFGGKLVNKLSMNPTPERFMLLSKEFTDNIGLISTRVGKILRETEDRGLTCSMAMLGECVFSLAKNDIIEELISIFKKHSKKENDLIETEIDHEGARLL
jgi:pantoate kinase